MRNLKLSIISPILFFLSTASLISQTLIYDGPVSGNWTLDKSPYLIQGNIEIPDDSTLVVDPGVLIEFQGHYGLSVQGVLLAEGTNTDSITFTINDTTGFHDPDTNLGGWKGIQIIDPDTTNDSTKFNYCKFEFAKAVGDVWYLNCGGALTILHFNKVHISNSLFENNSAGGDSTEVPSGGAVHLAWSNVRFTNNTFSNNKALSGGAIQFHESNPKFVNNTFKNNFARHASGAIDAGTLSKPTFKSDRILNNRSNYNGGGISFWDSTLAILEDVTISDNLSRDGGGIYTTSANVSFNNCSLSNNGASAVGGGINSFNSNLDFLSCNFIQDTASIFGGGAGFYESEVDLDNCSFSNNISGILGGGFHTDFSNINITNCTFENDSSSSGGAIFTWYSQMDLNENSFNNNSSKDNGGAIHSEYSSIDINNTSLNQNRSIWGGGIFFHDVNSRITSTEIISNQSEHGGGFNAGFSTIELNDVSFSENTSIWGGAMTITNSNLSISDCDFQDNHAEEAGAFEYIADTMNFQELYNVNIAGTNFSDNIANIAFGAFKFIQNESENSLIRLKIDDCTILNNSCSRVNVLISNFIKDFTVSNSIFTGNNTSTRTAGFNFSNNVTGTVQNCLFNDNFTSGGSSVASVGLNSNVAFINCTVVNNMGENGAAITLRNSGNAQLLNSIIWNNSPYNSILAAVTDSTPCKLEIYYSDVQFGPDSIMLNDSVSIVNWADGNLDTNPFFIDSESDFHLMDNSPCIGVGIDSFFLADKWYNSPQTDIEGMTRPNPQGSKPDLGAYENENGIPTDVDMIENIPDQYMLYQNYPNPFNPTTVIKYTIPVEVKSEKSTEASDFSLRKVTLKVYDILGREVTTLLNEIQKPGKYEVVFDGGYLPSDVYFYRLTTENYVKVRKMVLIR